MKKFSRAAVACLIGTTLLSCGGDGPTDPPVLTTLGVSFPTGTIMVGQAANATAAGLDQNGASIATGTVAWSTGSSAVATVNASGVVTGVAPGQTQVIATAGGKQAQALVTVIPVPVANVTVSPATVPLAVDATQQLTATARDAGGNVLSGRVVTWGTSDASKAAVSSTGLVTAVGEGVATITATSEGISGTAQVTVSASGASCNSAVALQMVVGAVQALTAAQKASLCLGGGASASEYVLIPFNSTSVAASTIQVQVTGTNTVAIQPGSLASLQAGGRQSRLVKTSPAKSFEWAFRERERRDLRSVFRSRRAPPTAARRGLAPSFLTNIPANPTVGSIVPINGDLSGLLCSGPKQLRGALVVAVLPNTIVLSDTTSPTGGYTTAEMTAFGEAFDTLGYALAVQNFGAPSDMDSNGRVAILFTPGVNVIPAPPGATVGGLFAARDLFPADPADGCVASNEGEMFYMPVPDPNQTINDKYRDKASMSRGILGILVHELQHLINAGRRIYVNNASDFEEVWLNEGLSHIAEELLYYRISGNQPLSNINLSVLQSTQAQTNAANTYLLDNMVRLSLFMASPELNSPFSQTDGLEMRGGIWQLLRYSADRRGGSQQSTWSALVNSTVEGQANFNAVFGDIIAMSRDWAVAQFTDDAGLSVSANLIHPSWNYRSVLPPINDGSFPLFTRPLTTPIELTLRGGGAAYLRFRVSATAPATISAASAGQPVSSAVDFFLVRTM